MPKKAHKFNKYGWKKDIPDIRDYKYVRPLHLSVNLPSSVDLRPQMPPVYEQNDLGACTSMSIAADIEFSMVKQGLSQWTPSRLFIYYNERVLENTVREDSGATLRNGIKSLVRWGYCKESTWGYDISKFARKPPVSAYREAVRHRITKYARIRNHLDDMKACLANNDPFFFGFCVYDSFESDTVSNTGVMTMPNPSETLLGGHAVLAVGFSDANQCFIVRNSWGASWGDHGYFYMPYSFITNPELADDFWSVTYLNS